MKTIQILIAALTLAAIPATSFGASKCDDCAACCKSDKKNTCTADCCAKK